MHGRDRNGHRLVVPPALRTLPICFWDVHGMFNLHLPVLYSESAEFALACLLAEVISQSGDISILDWIRGPSVLLIITVLSVFCWSVITG